MKAPCKDCPNRTVNCHARCLAYIDFSQANAVRRDEIKKKKIINNMIRQHKRDACEKQRRKHERH